MRSVADKIEKILSYPIVWSGVVLLAGLFVQVVNRYVLAVSWPFIHMLVPLCFIWLSMLGAAVAVRRKMHFDINLISGRLKPMMRRCHLMAIAISVILGGTITIWTGVEFFKLGLLKKDPSTGAPMVYGFASILMGGVLICLFALEQFWKRFSQSPHSDEETGL